MDLSNRPAEPSLTMPYAIMRSKKVKSVGHAAACCKHMYREQQTDNADPNRTPTNQHLAAKSTNEAMGKLKERLPERRRKDAVVAVEYLMTASPEWWDKAGPKQQAEWVDKSREWLERKYGAENLIACTVHRDELTPHLTALVVPLTKDGRLSAREMIGDRDAMKADQTSYAASVASLGLSRGVEGSKAKHSSVKSFYGRIAAAAKAADQIPPEPRRPAPPAVAPEPPGRHWWGGETAQHKGWKVAEAKKASQHAEKLKRWQVEHKGWKSQIYDLATMAGSLGLEAKQGRQQRQAATKASAAAKKARQELERVLATPGVREAIEEHKQRAEGQGRAQEVQRAAEVAATQKAQEKALEAENKPKPKPGGARHYENDGPTPGR